MREPCLSQESRGCGILRPATRYEKTRRIPESFQVHVPGGLNQKGLIARRVFSQTIVPDGDAATETFRNYGIKRMKVYADIVAVEIHLRDSLSLRSQNEAHGEVVLVRELDRRGQSPCDALGSTEIIKNGPTLDASRFHVAQEDDFQ